ncbi:ATP-binding protein [Streptomyces sp. NPDC059373]
MPRPAPATCPQHSCSHREAECQCEPQVQEFSAALATVPSAACPAGTISAHWSFPAQAVHAHLARRWLTGLLDTFWDDTEAIRRAIQVFGEVIANAVEHGRGPVTVLVALRSGALLCEVGDASPRLPAMTAATEDDEHHRGLAMIHAILGHAPHVRCTPTGKIVGFTVTTRRSTPAG